MEESRKFYLIPLAIFIVGMAGVSVEYYLKKPVIPHIAESVGLDVSIDGSCTSTSPQPTDALLILKDGVLDGNILDRGAVIDKSVDVRVIIDGEKRDMTWEEFKQRMR